jgi:hypothetical protein
MERKRFLALRTLPRIFAFVFCFLLPLVARAQEVSSPFQFVSYYINSLGTLHRIQVADQTEPSDAGIKHLAACVHSSMAFGLELTSQISKLKTIHLAPPADEFPSSLAGLYQSKVDIYNQLGKVCGALLGAETAPTSGRLTAQALELGAQLQFADKALLDLSTLAILPLIIAGSNRLTVTGSQRKQLIDAVTQNFGSMPKQTERVSYPVGAAFGLQVFLLDRRSRSADDPPGKQVH